MASNGELGLEFVGFGESNGLLVGCGELASNGFVLVGCGESFPKGFVFDFGESFSNGFPSAASTLVDSVGGKFLFS